MSNPWYTRAFAAVAGGFARASAVKSEFTRVEQGFDALFLSAPTSITALTGVPSMVGKALKLLRVNVTENGIDYVSPWQLIPKVITTVAGVYTVVAADMGYLLISQDATAVTIKVDKAATVPSFAGDCFGFHQEGAGQVTIGIVAASGVTLDAAAGLLSTRVQFSSGMVACKSVDRWAVSGDLNINLLGVNVLGRHSLWIPASDLRPSVAGGSAALASVATAANQPDVWSLDFDATTEEYAQFAKAMPKSWNEGSLSFKAVWSHAATAVNFGVVWSLQALAVSDLDPIPAAFGTQQNVTDTGGTTNTEYVSPESTAMTVAGTPAAEDIVYFRVFRKAADAADTMAIDARLHGLILYYTIDAATDA